jgi:hypothetical protein
MIVAFGGRKFSGKDTAAEALIDRHKFVRIALADKLKDICAKVFDIYRSDMDNPDLKEKPFSIPILIRSSHINDLLDQLEDDGFIITENMWSVICHEFVGKKLLSIRECLQIVGTDICRNYIADDMWLQYVSKVLDKESRDVVITDARYKNERDFLKSKGAILVLVKRKSLENKTTQTDLHISENQLGDESEYDVIVNNDSCKTQLQSSMSIWFILRNNGTSSNY